MKTLKLNRSIAIVLMTGFGSFDANSLLLAEVQTDVFATERTLIPEGDVAYKIGKPKISSGEKDGKAWARLTLPLECIDKAVLADLGVDKISTRREFFLDLTENNTLASGTNQNVELGRTFEAAGLYGESASLAQLEGRSVIGKTVQRTSDAGNSYNEVTKLAAFE